MKDRVVGQKQTLEEARGVRGRIKNKTHTQGRQREDRRIDRKGRKGTRVP